MFIDYAKQLPGTPINELGIIDGLNSGDITKSALFISHYHGDHIGKIAETHAQLPIYNIEGIIPIHTEAPGEFEKAFPNHKIIRLKDKDVYEIAIPSLDKIKIIKIKNLQVN